MSSKRYHQNEMLTYRHHALHGINFHHQVQDARVGREREEEVSIVVSLTDNDTPVAVLWQ